MTTPLGQGVDAQQGRGVDLLVISASSGDGSFNTRLAQLGCRIVDDHGGTATFASIDEFDTANYNRDDQDRDGFPTARRGCASGSSPLTRSCSPHRSTTSPFPAG